MTAKDAKELADSKALVGLEVIYDLVRKGAEKGDYYVIWYGSMRTEVIASLVAQGYDVSNYTSDRDGVCYKISWR